MTSHVISDPAQAPATPPAQAGWEVLSAELTAEAPPIADRDDLIVTIAPGAAHGHPAVFFPARAAIEIDGDLLGIDPGTAHPDRLADRARYAAVWGAFTHECAHAQHSRWDPSPATDPAVAEAAMLLEESRIEAAHVRRRPDDRHWLRASATEIIIGDVGGPDAAKALPATDYAAAHTAALLLARVDGGILERSECGPAADAAEKILGTTKLEALQEIWQTAQATGDQDAAGMLELGRQWLDLVGPDPHADPDPNSILSAAIADSIANIRKAVDSEQVPADPADAAREAARVAAVLAAAAQQAAREVFSKTLSQRNIRAPRPQERSAARVLARALNAASQRERAMVKSTSAVPPGRLRMRGAMARQAQRAAGAIPTAEPFTRTTRRATPVPPLRVAIACDVSSSMENYAAPVASAAWIIAYAAELATMSADTATVTFGLSVDPITYPGTAPARVTEFTCPDYDHALGAAIDALDGALGLSRHENTRLLVIISDGCYWGDRREEAQKRIDRLRAAGCAVLWLAPDNEDAVPLDHTTVHMLTTPATTAAAIATAAVTAVRHA